MIWCVGVWSRLISLVICLLAFRLLSCAAFSHLSSSRICRHMRSLVCAAISLSLCRMGWDTEEHRGLIPRICSALFQDIKVKSQDSLNTFHVEVSYMEI